MENNMDKEFILIMKGLEEKGNGMKDVELSGWMKNELKAINIIFFIIHF